MYKYVYGSYPKYGNANDKFFKIRVKQYNSFRRKLRNLIQVRCTV